MAAIEQRRRCFAVPRRNASRRLSACTRDALNRVTARRVNGAVTQGWIYKDNLAPVAETDAEGNVVSFFVYARGIKGTYRDIETNRLLGIRQNGRKAAD